MAELEQVASLQQEIWGAPEVAAPSYLLKAMSVAGGIVLLAEGADQPLGFAYGFTGRSSQGSIYHRSHAAGVVAGARDSGIGGALKLAQREQALTLGLSLMVWTFDPTQGRNAHFNLNRLGATARRFHRDYYGERSDPMNHGRHSDRLVVEWRLLPEQQGPVEQMRRNASLEVSMPPALVNPSPGPRTEAAYRKFREAMEDAFSRGLVAVGYDRERMAYYFSEPAGSLPAAVE